MKQYFEDLIYGMKDIPVTIYYRNRPHYCMFGEVSGSSTKWHLMEDNLYCGSLNWSETRGFWFGSNTWEDEEESIAEQLERYLVSWYG